MNGLRAGGRESLRAGPQLPPIIPFYTRPAQRRYGTLLAGRL